jgi:hypothetical protein
MKTEATAKPKATRTRIAEIALLVFIAAFAARAEPNLDVLPNIPWAQYRTNGDLGNTDDVAWGKYARMKFLETHPPEGTPTLKPFRPEKCWTQQPRIHLA